MYKGMGTWKYTFLFVQNILYTAPYTQDSSPGSIMSVMDPDPACRYQLTTDYADNPKPCLIVDQYKRYITAFNYHFFCLTTLGGGGGQEDRAAIEMTEDPRRDNNVRPARNTGQP